MTKVLIENKAVPLSDTTTKFGFGQISKTSPPWTKKVFRIVLYTATALTVVTQIVTEIPVEISHMVTKYAVEAVALVHALSKMFGVELKED